MKTIIATILILITGNNLNAQTTSVTKLFSVELPKSTGNVELKSLQSSKIRKSKRFTGKIHLGKNVKSETFDSDGFIITFITMPGTSFNNRNWLKEMKKMFDNIDPSHPTLPIQIFPNFSVLVTNSDYKEDQIGKYSFFIMNNSGSKRINGALDYVLDDKKRAKKTLDKVLSTFVIN